MFPSLEAGGITKIGRSLVLFKPIRHTVVSFELLMQGKMLHCPRLSIQSRLPLMEICGYENGNGGLKKARREDD